MAAPPWSYQQTFVSVPHSYESALNRSQRNSYHGDAQKSTIETGPFADIKPHVLHRLHEKIKSPEKEVVRFTHSLRFLLFGSTGSGKSTTGNFLIGLPAFRTSDELESCTRLVDKTTQTTEISAETFWRVSRKFLKKRPQKTKDSKETALDLKIPIEVYDTPGLNEADPLQECQNTKLIFGELLQIRRMDMVLICLPFGERLTDQLKKSLTYYRKLLQGVFESQNWGIVLSKVSAYQFHSRTFGQVVQEFRNCVKGFFGALPPHTFYFNPFDDESPEFWKHTQNTRDEIIIKTLILPQKIIPGMYFPLPPDFEIRRESISRIVKQLSKSVFEELLESFEGFKIQESGIQSYLDKKEEKFDRLKQLREKINELSTVVSSLPLSFGGQDMLHFIAPTKEIPISFIDALPNYKLFSHNCTSSVDVEDQRIQITIRPNRVTWLKNAEGFTWHFRLDFEWDGREVNKDQILRIEREMAMIKSEINDLREIVRKNFNVIKVQAKHQERFVSCARQFNRLAFVANTLSAQTFRYEEIDGVFKLLSLDLVRKKEEREEGGHYMLDFEKLNFEEFAEFEEVLEEKNVGSGGSGRSGRSAGYGGGSSLASSVDPTRMIDTFHYLAQKNDRL